MFVAIALAACYHSRASTFNTRTGRWFKFGVPLSVHILGYSLVHSLIRFGRNQFGGHLTASALIGGVRQPTSDCHEIRGFQIRVVR
jgi:hypothetical protein